MKIPLLLDVYGVLLTDRKREMMEYYYNEDYSLAEISEETGISRQGVRDSIKKTVTELHELEDKLHMAERLQLYEECFTKASTELTAIAESTTDQKLKERLNNVLDLITEAEGQFSPIAD